MKQRLIVIGAGAAGFFCAVNAAAMDKDLEVIILEKTSKILSKVKVSGGGRCNVTHACSSIPDMIKSYPRGANFLKKAFHHFFTNDTIQWFAERGVKLKTEADGRMFPITDDSQTIVDCLVEEANKYNVQVLMNKSVTAIRHGDRKKIFLELADKQIMECDNVCIAAGGYAKEDQFNYIKQLKHSIIPPVPSLFTFNLHSDPITELMGISTLAEAKIFGTKLKQDGPLLLTHWGFSGPAVLKLSAFGARTIADMNYTFTLIINWLPGYNDNSLLTHFQTLRKQLAAQKISNRNPFQLPSRLWDYLLKQSQVDTHIRWADLPAKQQNLLIQKLVNQNFLIKGKTTFKEEFVTSGGVDTNEIDTGTMQSKLVPGVFFAGEVINVDGITGGFNFQHAWTSGWLAAHGITST